VGSCHASVPKKYDYKSFYRYWEAFELKQAVNLFKKAFNMLKRAASQLKCRKEIVLVDLKRADTVICVQLNVMQNYLPFLQISVI